MSDWKKVGEIGVDAGLCMVGDPCYVSCPNNKDHPVHDWDKFCQTLQAHDKAHKGEATAMQLNYALGHAGLGVVVSTGYGDGIYPVYVRKNSDGRIVAVKVEFDNDEED